MTHAVGDAASSGVFTQDLVVGLELGGADVGPQYGGGDVLPRRLHYPVKLELPALAIALSVPFSRPDEAPEEPTSDIVPSPASFPDSPLLSGTPVCGPTAATRRSLASTACPCVARAYSRSSGSGPGCAGRQRGC